MIEQIDPTDEGATKAHGLQGLAHEWPFYTVKGLFLV